MLMELRYARLDPRLQARRLRRRPGAALLGVGVLALVIILLLSRCGAEGALSTAPVVTVPPGESLRGMKGTRPTTAQDEGFRADLRAAWTEFAPQDGQLSGYDYAAEAYDAVMVAALAAEAARSDGGSLADSLVGITSGLVECSDFSQCRDLVRRGESVGYRGVSGPVIMNAQGENVVTKYAVVEFGADNRIDPSLTRVVDLMGERDAPAPTVSGPRREGDGVLTIGSLLPITGQLASYAPAQQAAIRLAIGRINTAGGVLGREVVYREADSGDTGANKMLEAVEELIEAEVDVIIGPSSTAVTVRVIDRILEAGIVQISPANTNMLLVGFDDQGLYFRMAASDDQQTVLLAELMEQDGLQRVGIFAVDDLYGNSLTTTLTRSLEARGIEVALTDLYSPNLGSFAENVEQMRAAEVDGIVVISFDEGVRLLRAMVDAGLGPEEISVYGVDSNMGDDFGALFDSTR